MKRTGLLWVAVAAIIVGGCSKTEGTKTSSEQPAPRPAAVGTGGAAADVNSDAEFVHDVAIMNMAEIELSRLALQKATSGDIKSFAQQMIDDHEAAGNTLKDLVSGHSIDWPAQLDDKHKETADDLAKKQGLDFDRDYAKAMVEGHQNFTAVLESRLDIQSVAEWKTAAAGRAQSKALPDPKVEMSDVKIRPNRGGNEFTTKINAWAADTYPVAQKHLDTARTLENAAKKRSTD
jgi:putative membrane protein